MALHNTDDLRIKGMEEVAAPEAVHQQHQITDVAAETVWGARSAIHTILQGEDDRLLVVVGPCSIHDVDAAKEYADRLKQQLEQHSQELLIVMRVYFEKPRTRIGWKGLINDPDLDQRFNINKGVALAREVLLEINNRGIPAATEFLDLITPQYIADLISWGAIGARTTESQVHRELASGLSCPVGFKNGTDGKLQIAIDGLWAASQPHHFLSVTKQGHSAIFSTGGNEDCHVILRGGDGRPNYDAESVQDAVNDLQQAEQNTHLMVDLSHANSRKDYKRQMDVGRDVAYQIRAGNANIMGVMVESHLVEGRQDLEDGKNLTYGQSVTDACISWDATVELLQQLADAVRKRRECAAA
ncbi:MAG: 3-deoxy-7-phosphoheptulonate synthase [Gammaproteobacteria bacterium]|jgi:3-deoxy-7-phosphoheptulonate synthase|nr:3-deoxy-7-phosphoheptulonate synthase [Gammaproteobacteria bacterium]MBT4608145.1 3-deoxy-7-phosphoheptulonate synthase [Thiotrichales bacterium]MBT3471907.1 3-deoxy-7-phosphoheptulonate synthase [Gammaproteobacteria bacterium]MBT3966671.1 3-deoxy-7-phosphoheptulonate synthase [Gammaproteobacteria bacterium]MBT4081890.1 3-deoxy-7-phosphoheptulonate synthase [Gammaproteobacteria bacterium]